MEALYQVEECEPSQRRRWLASYHSLFEQAASRLPAGRSREDLHAAILTRVRQKRTAMKRQPPTLPPKA